MLNRNTLLIKVASFYYEDDLTQSEIAKKIGVSRPTVASMLKEAREKEIVKIIIQNNYYEEGVLRNREFELANKYDLKSVSISSTYKNEAETKAEIGRLCAEFIEKRREKINALGISWGTTVKAFVDAANYVDFPNLEVVPLIGGVSITDTALHSNHLSFTLGQKYKAYSNSFYAPVIAENKEIKKFLYNSEVVQNILEKGRSVDLAVIGVGNPQKSKTYRHMGYITSEEEQEINEKNAIGDILTTFYDQEGEPVITSLTDRMIGPSLKDIQNMKEVIVLANGKNKVISIKSLLKMNIINHLFIDDEIAKQLWERIPFYGY